MSMPPLDIVVCGCGPGGMAAALLLQRAGHRVRVFEQFETPMPIGSGLMLQPTGMAVLAELGLAERMRGLGQRIDRLFGRALPSNRIVLDVRYAALPGEVRGLAVHRGALFTVLHDAVRAAGIEVMTSRSVVGLDHAASGRPILRLADGERLEPIDLVVDALGGRSPLARQLEPTSKRQPLAYGALWATLPWPGDGASNCPFGAHDLEQRYAAASLMVGVLPVGRRHESGPPEATFFWSLKPSAYEQWRMDGLDIWKARVCEVWPQTEGLLEHIRDPDQLVLASYAHHTMRKPYGDGVAVIGDAAHSTSPQLGQGANMALLDALALARSVQDAPALSVALADYAARRRRHVRVYQAMSAVFTPFYQSDSRLLPRLRDTLVQPMCAVPGVPRLLASIVAGTIGRPLTPLQSRNKTSH